MSTATIDRGCQPRNGRLGIINAVGILVVLVLSVAISQWTQAGRIESLVRQGVATDHFQRAVNHENVNDLPVDDGIRWKCGPVDGWNWCDARIGTRFPEPVTLLIGFVALGSIFTQRPLTPQVG